MHWRRVDPAQRVDGLLVTGTAARDAALQSVSRRAASFPNLHAVIGVDWLVLTPSATATQEARRELVLPRLESATPLYERLEDIWLPVGWEAGVPAHAEPVLLRAALTREGITAAVVIAPFGSGETTQHAHVYVLDGRMALTALPEAAALG